ncbi:MAG TPA: hypothetical protein VL500_00205 [Candidatus Eisenbacteria bacterium]|nr:hypothetical protein [Candidatus Eisenbacteria bacterium]
MDFLYDTFWLWLFIMVACFIGSSRSPRLRRFTEPLFTASGLLFIVSLVLRLLPRSP